MNIRCPFQEVLKEKTILVRPILAGIYIVFYVLTGCAMCTKHWSETGFKSNRLSCLMGEVSIQYNIKVGHG